jgi:hypothetical protein
MKAKNALSLLLAAGVVAPAVADNTPAMSPKGFTSGTVTVGHIYYNVATGEKIATAMRDGAAPRGVTNPEIWVADNNVPCADIGPQYTIGFVGFFDDPAYTTAAAVGATFLNWGDTPQDTVIDTVQVSTYVDHLDVDADGDGLADGVEGLGCTWTFYDGDNGFNSCLTRTGLVGFTLINLPGNTAPGTEIQGYIYTIELSDFLGDGSVDLSFEIADSDGDTQGAAVHNEFFAIGDLDFDGIPDGDLDGDGLADFSYGQQFIQPGTADFDDDGQPDGNPADAAVTYVELVAPRGSVDPVTGELTIDQSPIGASAGAEDAFDILTDINDDGFFEPFGTFFYGGFTCDRDADGVFEGDTNGSAAPNGPNDYRAFSQFFLAMYGPGGPIVCRPDVFPIGAPDGILNFFDISTFVSLYNAQDPAADFFPAAGGDGNFNFFDISTFIGEYNAGCP